MPKLFLIKFFCILSFTLNAYQSPHFHTYRENLTYLLWDNCTYATEEDLLADPLLALRTAERYSDSQDSTINAYKRSGRMDFFANASQTAYPITSGIHVRKTAERTAEADNAQSIQVTNTNQEFYLDSPRFNLNCSFPGNNVWWQISPSESFSEVISTFESICPFNTIITLSDLEETFLENETTYYFRARCGGDDLWSPWSNIFAFTVVKPEPVANVHFEHADNTKTDIVWEAPTGEGQSFLVFGSNSIDFIPDIFSQEQPEAIVDDKVVAMIPANNYLGETQLTHFPIDKRFAYYRVIAKAGNSLSKPSKLLPIGDGLPVPERDVMLCEDGCDQKIYRKKFPEGYQWMQKKVHSNTPPSTQYVRNPYVTEEIWNSVSPYFIPEHLPEKAALDRIFSKRRVLSSVKSMYKSGFNLITRSKHKIIVGRHPGLKGYIIKAFLDESTAPDWMCLMKRIDGVRAIQQKIIEKGYEGIMKAPQKWIYPLPPEPSPLKDGPNRKNFILIAQEMDLLDRKHNLKAYKTKMTPQILDAFYVMLTELQLIDSVYADNTGFCEDGRLAFVDTEHSLNALIPVPLPTVAQYLSPEMIVHWQHLYFYGVPQP